MYFLDVICFISKSQDGFLSNLEESFSKTWRFVVHMSNLALILSYHAVSLKSWHSTSHGG
eukprot:c36430_g1_i1 orf=3-179(-)